MAKYILTALAESAFIILELAVAVASVDASIHQK